MIDIKKLNLKINRYVDSLFVGNYKTAFKGRGIEFFDYRLYDTNDDAKYIDFLASAREGKLLIKRYTEERELTVFFLLDVSETMYFGYHKQKIQTMLETFYTLAFSALKNNDKIGAIIFNDTGFELIKPGKGSKNIHRILQVISENNIKKQSNFSPNLVFSFFNNLPVRNSLVFLLSDKMDEIDDKNLKIISIKNDFVYINIFDRLENDLLDDGGVLKIGNQNDVIFLNLYDNKKIEQYKQLRAQRIQALKNKLGKYTISYLTIDDSTNIFARLLTFFKTR